jgi:hypothetical protein
MVATAGFDERHFANLVTYWLFNLAVNCKFELLRCFALAGETVSVAAEHNDVVIENRTSNQILT